MDERIEDPTYTLYVAKHIEHTTGKYYKMVDEVFNDASLDCWIDNFHSLCYIDNFAAKSIADRDLTIQYFCSNLFNRLLELNGYIGFHSSCVEKNGKGVLFIGDRLAGKTTSMIALINAGFNLISNDCTALKFFPDSKFVDAFGVPNTIFVRMSRRFCSQPENSKYLEIAKTQNVSCEDDEKLLENRITLSHLEIAELNGVAFLPSVRVHYIFLPRYNLHVSKAKFTALDRSFCMKFFQTQIEELIHDTTLFLEDITIPASDAETLVDCTSHMSDVPCFLCEYNENTRNDFVWKINEILENRYDFS